MRETEERGLIFLDDQCCLNALWLSRPLSKQNTLMLYILCGVDVPLQSSTTSEVVSITYLEPSYLLWPPLGPGEAYVLFPQQK